MPNSTHFVYSASFDAQSITTATDIFEVTVAANRPVTALGLSLGQTSDLGDAQEEVLRIGLYRGVTAGATGTALTEAAYTDANLQTATAAAVALRGTASTGGTLLEVIPWNIRIPLLWCPVPELRPRFSAGDATAVFSFRLLAAPADAITASGTMFWTEE